MKSRETLIRLRKFQVDEKRRRTVQIETMIAEFDRMTVELDREARTFLADADGIDCPDRAWFGFTAVGGESREVMSADEMFRGRFQNLQIE